MPPTFLERIRSRAGVLQFILGSLFGFFVSTTISLHATFHILSTGESVSLSVAHTALRALQSVRHFPEENGWSMIHVFYGNNSHLPQSSDISSNYLSNNQWFSQCQQDRLVSHLLRNKTNGYFIDLSANDAIKISNSYALETYFNWTGLCIEPNPKYWPGLSYRNCDVVAAVLGHRRMDEITFKFGNRAAAQSGIVGEQFDNKRPSKFGEDRLRYTVTLDEVLDRFGAPKVIDYLSLDVEGAEEFILAKFPFERYQFHVITVERPSEVLRQVLRSNQYIELAEIKHAFGEFLWAHKSMLKFLDTTALDIDTENFRYSEHRA